MFVRFMLMLLIAGLAGFGRAAAADEPAPPSDGTDEATDVQPAEKATDPAADEKAEEKPAARPKGKPAAPPSPSTEAQQAAAASAALLDPTLARLLQQAWNPASKRFDFSSGDNVSILSLPDGFGVYIASVDSIQGGGGGTGDPTVEDTLFSSGNFRGDAPLTVALEPGDYVIGVRADKRVYGFDGDCVRKATTDVITGGKGHAYHLYMLRKKAGEYQCLIANFSDGRTPPEILGEALGTRETFRVSDEELVAALAQSSNVPEELRERVAEEIRRLGLAFYRTNGLELLVKGFIRGESFVIQEWPVEN